MKPLLVFTVTAGLALSGCASHTGIVPMGRDTFMIAKQAATGVAGLSNLKAEIIGDASRHCASVGKTMNVTSTQESAPPYILGNYPRAEIQFECVASK